MNNTKISFTSRILAVNDFEKFRERVKPFEINITDPWTAKEIERGQQAFTIGVMTCTAGGIITKSKDLGGFDVVSFHMQPPQDHYNFGPAVNLNLKDFEKTLLAKLGEDAPLRAFLFGSRTSIAHSGDFFSKIEAIIQKLKIPYSKIKGLSGNVTCGHVAYDGKTDEWLLHIVKDSEKVNFFRDFSEVKIEKGDKLLI